MKITFEGSTLAEVLAGVVEFVEVLDGGFVNSPPKAEFTGAALQDAIGPGRPAGAKDSSPRKRGPNKAKVTTLAAVAPDVSKAPVQTLPPINAETPAAEGPALKTVLAAEAPAVSAPKLADAQNALAALFEAKGMTDSLKVLAEFKVKKVQELKPDAYTSFIAYANAAAVA